MSAPASRKDFAEYCLRSLGKGAIEINVTDDQIDDRIDQALKYYWDYHFDGADRVFVKHIVTDLDITNRYITLPDNIIGAVRMFSVGDALSTNNIFDIRYQIALNDLYTLTSVSMIPYYMAMQQIQFIEQLLVGQQPIRFTRTNHQCFIDMDWQRVAVDNFIILECYQVVDPDTFTSVWGDRWLFKYTSALI